MAKATGSTAIAEEKIINKIYLIREKKVMLDGDLAQLYGVETRVLNQAVKRNERRFPLDFMFRLTDEEFRNLKSQFVISSLSGWGGIRKPPLAFTEQGVAMLSSVLGSETAIEVNIEIIRIFTRMRELLLSHKDILLKLEQIEKQLLQQDTRLNRHEKNMQIIFNALRELLSPPTEPRPRIGFRRKDEQEAASGK